MTITTYEPCDECGSPTDEQQRYCVSCGANLRRPGDPVGRYFATSAAARRVVRSAPRPATGPRRRRTESRWIAVAFALLPIAAAIGVAVGRDTGNADANLVAALKAQKAPVVNVGGGAAGEEATIAAAAISSDFSLERGFVVELSTLAAADADAAAVRAAKDAAKEKGAKDVGVINPADFILSPDSSGDLVIYSGEFKGKGDATKALAKLKKDFPKAKVVEVSPSATSTTAKTAADGGPTAADVPGYKATPTAKEEKDGAAIVERIKSDTGKSYVESQRDLPAEIVVP
ncbi:MAG: hypothetical protein QOI80_1015 [Solirubrobacteraceae bacterium]|jgi:hypothetical protein|nr:hypothetical protein [Solirubrobacteraceae bacterium]